MGQYLKRVMQTDRQGEEPGFYHVDPLSGTGKYTQHGQLLEICFTIYFNLPSQCNGVAIPGKLATYSTLNREV